MVPLIAVEAIGAGAMVGALETRARRRVRSRVLAAVAYELRPLDRVGADGRRSAMGSAQRSARAQVTACLGPPQRGMKIMASMGSLGHYMQETSRAGFAIRDFLHEGNGDIWLAALEGPYPFAQWILIEEKAAGRRHARAHRARATRTFSTAIGACAKGRGSRCTRRVGIAEYGWGLVCLDP